MTLYLWLLLLLIAPMAYAAWRYAPPVSTQHQDVERLIRLANIQPTDSVTDLGAGFGQLVIGAAKHSKAKRIVGYELSPLNWLWSWVRVLTNGYHQRVRIRFADFTRVDLTQYQVILLFITPTGFTHLTPKLEKKLAPGTTILSYIFPIPGWTATETSQPDDKHFPIYLYKR